MTLFWNKVFLFSFILIITCVVLNIIILIHNTAKLNVLMQKFWYNIKCFLHLQIFTKTCKVYIRTSRKFKPESPTSRNTAVMTWPDKCITKPKISISLWMFWWINPTVKWYFTLNHPIFLGCRNSSVHPHPYSNT